MPIAFRRAGVLVLAFSLACGCASLRAREERAGRGHWPEGGRWRAAARGALHDPATWAPLAGAAALAAGGWDVKLSRWAAREAPLFGSKAHARDASDTLRGLTHYASIAAALAAPDGGGPWQSRIGRLAIDQAAATAATSVTYGLKRATGRTRPDRSDRESFPSGHSSRAFAYAATGMANLRATRLAPGWRHALDGGLIALAAGTAWARVEAGVHYPTDVLVGASLGNFLGRLVHDAFAAGGGCLSGAEVDLQRDGVRFALRFDLRSWSAREVRAARRFRGRSHMIDAPRRDMKRGPRIADPSRTSRFPSARRGR